MIKAIVSDFSRVILFPKDKNYTGSLNVLHKELSVRPDYHILDHFEVNHELLVFYKTLTKRYKLAIFTSDVIQDEPEIRRYLEPTFKHIFSATKMKIDKKDPVAYKMIATELKLKQEEIIYVDDSVENIQAANESKMRTIQYKDNPLLFDELK